MEVLFGDAVVLSQHSFCLIPEVLNAVDVVFSDGISRLFLDFVISLWIIPETVT